MPRESYADFNKDWKHIWSLIGLMQQICIKKCLFWN